MQEAPYNAPPDGAFLLVMYAGSAGPIHVDWTWQPQSRAVVPANVRILFDRVGLPRAAPVARPTEQDLAARLTERSVFFWMMVQVAAKTIARQQPWSAVIILNYARETLHQVKWLLNLVANPELHNKPRIQPVPALPADQMALVRALANDMQALTPRITSLGGQPPTGVIPLAYRFFELIDAIIDHPPTGPE